MGITVRAGAPATWRIEESEDEQLARAVRDGDDGAFELLFRRHQPAVLAFCRHMLGRADEAQDAAQHTFFVAYRVLRAGERLEAVRPWLFTVARNRCVSMLRARREDHPGEAVVEPSTDGLAAEVQQRADLRALLRDLAELPDDQRAALLLAEVADFSHAEIADVIGVRRAKVKALVFQAREALVAAKDARDTPCDAVREELATARGAALRRTQLRRHLHTCAGCREFRDQLRDQRRALGLLLPVAPSALRDASLVGTLEAGAGAGAAASVAATGIKAIAAKLAIGGLLAGGVAAGGTAAVVLPASDPAPPASDAGARPAGSTTATTPRIEPASTGVDPSTPRSGGTTNASLDESAAAPGGNGDSGANVRGQQRAGRKSQGGKSRGRHVGAPKAGGANPGRAKARPPKARNPRAATPVKGGGRENRDARPTTPSAARPAREPKAAPQKATAPANPQPVKAQENVAPPSEQAPANSTDKAVTPVVPPVPVGPADTKQSNKAVSG
jgi:RNA polymerase sigma factor (sigma-70 family)